MTLTVKTTMNKTGDLRVDQIMPKLFSFWETLPFEECLKNEEFSYKKLKKKDIRSTGKIPVIDQGEKFFAGYIDDHSKAYAGPLPVIIFGDHTRRTKYIDFKFAIGADGTKILIPFEMLSPKYFYYYLNSLKLESQGYSRHYRFLKEINVPLPPLNEQRRIVAKLEKLLHKVDACKERLEKIPAILKRFRQSILATACSGRLTGDWRGEKVNGEKMPSTWHVKKIRDIELFIGSGITPKGGKTVYLNKGIPFIRSQNVYPLRLVLDDVVFINPEMHESMSRTKLKPKDILLNITGASIGRSAIIPDNFTEGNVNQHVCIIRLQSVVIPKFAVLFLNSPDGQDLIFSTQTGVTREGLNYGQIREFKLPLPSLPEQHEIVRRVDALFRKADEIEARYKKAKAFVDRLTQSILAKAFRGELVPQDPNDEPASVLLERIKMERTKQETKRRGKKVTRDA